MSEGNVEIVRRVYEASARHDVEAVLAVHIAWDISAHPLPDWPDHGKGRENLLRNLAEYLTGWRHYESEPREFIDRGEDIIVVLHETARIGESEAMLDRDLVQVWTVQGDQAVKLRVLRPGTKPLTPPG